MRIKTKIQAIRKKLKRMPKERVYKLNERQIKRFLQLLIREHDSVVVKTDISLPAFVRKKYSNEINEINNLIK